MNSQFWTKRRTTGESGPSTSPLACASKRKASESPRPKPYRAGHSSKQPAPPNGFRTRLRGYGTRDQAFVGGPYGEQLPDGLAGIAVPLLGRGRVHGVINVIWPKPARTIEDMAKNYLADLQSAAAEIVNALQT